MRILALPLALTLSFCLYLPLPRAAEGLGRGVDRLYTAFERLLSQSSKRLDGQLILGLFLLLFGGACQLAGFWHPLAAAVVTAPLFSALTLLPQAVRAKEELDSGVLSRDIEGYEARVRSVCASLGPAFVTDLCAPLLILALGTPLRLSCALGGIYFALRALCEQEPQARRAVALIRRPAWAVMRGMLLLCSCVVGRNPLRAHGDDPRALLLSILGIAGDGTDTHAPVAGDIAQAVFLCCFASALLCLMLTVALFPLCR